MGLTPLETQLLDWRQEMVAGRLEPGEDWQRGVVGLLLEGGEGLEGGLLLQFCKAAISYCGKRDLEVILK